MSDSQYFRTNAKKNYELKKELSIRFRTEGNLGERFSDFVKRIKLENSKKSDIS